VRKLCLVSLFVALLVSGHPPDPAAHAQAGTTRRVNIPYSASGVTWGQSAIFWFGQNEWLGWDHLGVPSRNYVDVRVAYTAQALNVRATVVDYYLWYNEAPGASDDLTAYDAVAIYVDTAFDRATKPQTDDYTFLVGARHWPNENAVQYHRQARGTGTGWNAGWSGVWTDYESMQWSCDPGPNDNQCGIDFGWTAIFTIPWGTVGLSGPPAEGTLWGLGVQLYDRDDQPEGTVAPEHWPEGFDGGLPSTWGQLHFGYARYAPPSAIPRGTVTIRAASPADNTVEDAWIGGGGTCGGGHEGGGEVNHGDDPDLFVGTEIAPTHLPCFNKSYLRFSLGAVPAGSVVLSATLTLHHWGNAGDPGQAKPSWVHLFTTSDPWDEMTIHWNNAPLAQENLSATWVYPVTSLPPWPGIPYHWDATQAVARAHAERQPLSIVLYGSDSDQHSSKYLTASETGDWNVAGRPSLTVIWGEPATMVHKTVWPGMALLGQTVTYTLSLLGSGQALTLTDTLPTQVSAPGQIQVTGGGEAIYDPGTRRLTWNGSPSAGQAVTITFAVVVQVSSPQVVSNTATLSGAQGSAYTHTAAFVANGHQRWLPLALRQWVRQALP